MTVPSTRIMSWYQLVLEADPGFERARRQPWIYSFSNGRLFYSPVDPYAPLPSSGLWDDGGVLALFETGIYPTSPEGLMPGELWVNGLTIAVIPGGVPQAGVAPMLFPGITADQLFLFGGANFQLTPPPEGSGIIWNDGNVVCVA